MALLALVGLTGPAAAQTERAQEAASLGVEGKEAIDEALNGLSDAGPGQLTDGGVEPTDDGGVAVDRRAPDGGTNAGPIVDEEQDALEKLIKEQEADRRRAEQAAKAAEHARQAALARASQAKSALLERILRQVAEAEGAKGQLAEADNRLRSTVQVALQDAAKRLVQAREGLSAARAVELGKADALLDQAIAEQRVALGDTREAVRARSSPPSQNLSETLKRIPPQDQVELSRQLNEEDRGEVSTRLKELQAAVLEVERAEAALDRAGAELWYGVAEARLHVATALNETRLLLLNKVSPARARALTGLTEAGRDNLTVALEHIGTTFSFHFLRRTHDLRLFPERLRDPLFSGALVWVFLRLLFAVALAVFITRRGPDLYRRARQGTLSRMTNRARVKLLNGTLAIAEDAAPQAGMLALSMWMLSILAQTGPEPELSIIFGILIWVLSYQLTSKLTHRLVLRLARRRHALTVPQKLKILRTVRVVMRFGFLAAYVLSTTRAMVGEGVLFGFMRLATALAAGVLFFVLVSRWRKDIVEVYLGGWSETGLARVIEANRGRWYALPLAVVALAAVAASAAIALAKDFVLGFEQSRKALAYLFQVRVERKAKEKGRRTVDVEGLPEVCKTAFAEAPCDNPRFLVDRFGEQPALVERLKNGRPLNVLVSAPAGGGASTWLRKLVGQLDAERVVNITPTTRWRGPTCVYKAVAEALEVTGTPDFARVRDAIGQRAERPIFVLDEVERTFLRGLDGYEALNALLELISETERDASFIVVGRSSAVRYLSKTRNIVAGFDRRIELGPWSETEIRELVLKRQKATGLSLSFEDLLVTELDAAVDAAQVVETENGYLRLLWSFAEGNPRTVLHFWLRSLVTAGDGLRVQLHDAPSADDLEVLDVQERFLLQAMVLLRALSAEDLARASNLPVSRIKTHLSRAMELGFYDVDAHEVYAVSPHFWQAAVRFLRRKNLL